MSVLRALTDRFGSTRNSSDFLVLLQLDGSGLLASRHVISTIALCCTELVHRKSKQNEITHTACRPLRPCRPQVRAGHMSHSHTHTRGGGYVSVAALRIRRRSGGELWYAWRRGVMMDRSCVRPSRASCPGGCDWLAELGASSSVRRASSTAPGCCLPTAARVWWGQAGRRTSGRAARRRYPRRGSAALDDADALLSTSCWWSSCCARDCVCVLTPRSLVASTLSGATSTHSTLTIRYTVWITTIRTDQIHRHTQTRQY